MSKKCRVVTKLSVRFRMRDALNCKEIGKGQECILIFVIIRLDRWQKEYKGDHVNCWFLSCSLEGKSKNITTVIYNF